MKKIRVLQIVPGLRGGIGSILINFCSRLDRDKYQIDFGVNYDSHRERREFIDNTMGKVYVLPRMSKDYREYKKFLSHLIEKNN